MCGTKLGQSWIYFRKPRTETLVNLTDGHHIPKWPIDGHGDPMEHFPVQRWFSDGSVMVQRLFSDGPSLFMGKFQKKIAQVEI